MCVKPAEWTTDTNTGKENIVLEKSMSTLNHDINQQKCRNIGGHLPESRDEQENLFLDSLSTDSFLLGIKKNPEDQWVYDSDKKEEAPFLGKHMGIVYLWYVIEATSSLDSGLV